MKRKLLFFCTLLSICGFTVAQNQSAVGDESTYLTNASTLSVVRNWQNSFSISSHSIQGHTHLVKTDFGMVNASTGTIPNYPALIADSIPNMFILDMKFVDEYAFIGGYILDSIAPHTYVKRGFLGYYSVSDIYLSNTLNIKLHIYDEFHEFFRLVAYYDVSDYKIVALGTYDTVQNLTYVVEDVIMSYSSSTTIRMSEFNFTIGTPKESVLDLLLIGDYVVFVGKRLSNYTPPYIYNRICVRKADRHNVISDPMMDIQHIYTTTKDEVNGNIIATYLKDKEFAVAYVYYNAATNNFYTRVRVIDASTMQMISSQEFLTYSKDEPIEMAYDPQNNILTLMHRMPFTYQASYNLTYFVQIDPYASSPYTAPVLYPDKGPYYSLDMFDGEYYVATGKNIWYYQHTTAPQPNANLCPLKSKIEVNLIPRLNKTTRSYPDTMSTSLYDESRSAVVKQTNISLLCDDE